MEDLSLLFTLIEERCDPDQIVDILGLESAELIELLRGHIIDNRAAFEAFLDIYEEEHESD